MSSFNGGLDNYVKQIWENVEYLDNEMKGKRVRLGGGDGIKNNIYNTPHFIVPYHFPGYF